jgi:hypothetical protein
MPRLFLLGILLCSLRKLNLAPISGEAVTRKKERRANVPWHHPSYLRQTKEKKKKSTSKPAKKNRRDKLAKRDPGQPTCTFEPLLYQKGIIHLPFKPAYLEVSDDTLLMTSFQNGMAFPEFQDEDTVALIRRISRWKFDRRGGRGRSVHNKRSDRVRTPNSNQIVVAVAVDKIYVEILEKQMAYPPS